MSNYIEKIKETPHFFSDADIFKLQSSVLDRTTSDNIHLQPHVIPSLSKNLETANKRIIKAVNEIHNRLNSFDNNFISFTDLYDTLIGDVKENPWLQHDLLKVGNCIIDALVKTHKSIYGNNLDEKIEINLNGISIESVTDAINKLYIKFIELQSSQNKVYDWVENESYHKYQLIYFNNILCRAKNDINESILNPFIDIDNWDVIGTLSIITNKEHKILSSIDINNKYIILEYEPVDIDKFYLTISGGTSQRYNIDYVISEHDKKRVLWGGYALDGELDVFDELIIIYNYIKYN